jgi:hypothetical protein
MDASHWPRRCDLLADRVLWILSSAAPIRASNALVKADALLVYAEMRTSARVVQSLKKDDAVTVDFEIQTTENWCHVRLPAEDTAGYVQCQGLDRLKPSSGSGLAYANPGRLATPGKNDVVLLPPSPSSANGYDQIARLVIVDGGIWFSSNWVGTPPATMEQMLAGGNLVVH